MIQEQQSTDRRRMLTFPAVHPCEGISPTTLLTSLIILSKNICNFYQSNSFPTQKRNAREVTRQVGILLIFLEEILDKGLTLSDSVVLSFSELHLAFQKIQFLLEDCSREGARLWILMKSQLVVNQFRVIISSIATALDVLPLEKIDVGMEVKELVELVRKQTRIGRIEVDPEVEFLSRDVYLMLGYFEKGIEPELSFIKQVISCIGIKGWLDCDKEVKFLEEEIGFYCSNCNDQKEVPFLAGLLGLICYCRGVVFETLDFRSAEEIGSDLRSNSDVLSCLNPEDFRCPISLELMSDPVTVSTGQTYDRSSIHKWFKAGNLTCPKTGEKVASTELVPNTTLQKLIQQFCAKNGVSLAKSKRRSRDITRTIAPISSVTAEAVKFLSRFLARRLVFGSNELKKKAAYEIRLLAKSNIYNRSCLIEAGTILPLLNLLSTQDLFTQENAISALLKLSKHASGKAEIIESDGLRQILVVLKEGLCLEVRQIAAATIFYLSSVKGNRKLIGENHDAIPALVQLIKDGTSCGKKNAVVAIFALLLHQGNHWKVIESGTVMVLLEMLTSPDSKDELKVDSLAVIAALAESYDGTLAVLQSTGLATITRALKSLPSRAAKENCVSIILSLCGNGGQQVVEILAKDPSLMCSLYSLLTEGTSQCRSKARALIKILQKFHETSSSGLVTSAAQCERPVHVW